jgi:tetratricopeptide (TPR) repeat protein
VRGNIATLSPILSPMLWNSIATGKLGDKHDILGFIEPDGKGGLRPVTSTSRKCKAIWNILSQRGLRSCIVNWFASHPPEKINGVIVSDKLRKTATPEDIRIPFNPGCVHPPELAEIAEQLQVLPQDLTPEQMLPFIPTLADIDEEKDRRHQHIARYIAECATIHGMATYLAEHEQWDLLAVYYDTIDHLGHGFMEFHPPKMEHTDSAVHDRYQHVMTATYLFHDLMLGRLMELAGPEAHVIVMSDHGFHSGALRPKLWLDPENPARFTGPGADPLAWHRQQGMIVIAGPGVKKDELVFGASLLDVMPTILALLGLPIAEDLDGKPLLQIFEQKLQTETIASYEPPVENDGVHRGEQADDPFAATESLQHLVDLGYIEPLSADAESNLRNCLEERKSVLAQIYYSSGRVAQAAEILRELTRDKKGAYLLNRLAMALMDLGRVDEAEEAISQIGEKDFELPVLLTIRGQLKYAKKDYDAAFELFRRASEADNTRPVVHVYLGLLHLNARRWQMAKESYQRAIAIDGDNAAAHDGLAVALRELGDLEQAMFHHMKSVSLVHNQPEGHVHLAQTAVLCGQFDWAIRALHVAAELAPAWPFPHRVLARLYRQVKNDLGKSHEHLKIASDLRLKHLREGRGKPTIAAPQ